MAQFPLLRSGSVMQYPAEQRAEFRTRVQRFLDGSEQRFRLQAAAERVWRVRLDLLDEMESKAISDFFEAQSGRHGVFEFRDPWTGVLHTNCRFDSDECEMTAEEEGRHSMTITIRAKVGVP